MSQVGVGMAGSIHSDLYSFHTFISSTHTHYCQRCSGSTGGHAQIKFSLACVIVNHKPSQKERDASKAIQICFIWNEGWNTTISLQSPWNRICFDESDLMPLILVCTFSTGTSSNRDCYSPSGMTVSPPLACICICVTTLCSTVMEISKTFAVFLPL